MVLKGNGFYQKWLQKSHLRVDIMNVYVDSWSLVLIDASWWIRKLEEQRTQTLTVALMKPKNGESEALEVPSSA